MGITFDKIVDVKAPDNYEMKKIVRKKYPDYCIYTFHKTSDDIFKVFMFKKLGRPLKGEYINCLNPKCGKRFYVQRYLKGKRKYCCTRCFYEHKFDKRKEMIKTEIIGESK